VNVGLKTNQTIRLKRQLY